MFVLEAKNTVANRRINDVLTIDASRTEGGSGYHARFLNSENGRVSAPALTERPRPGCAFDERTDWIGRSME